jgi:hypothetical protein
VCIGSWWKATGDAYLPNLTMSVNNLVIHLAKAGSESRPSSSRARP